MSGLDFEGFDEGWDREVDGQADSEQSDESSSTVEDQAVEPGEEEVEVAPEPEEELEQPEAAAGPAKWDQVLAGDIDWAGIDRAPLEQLPPVLANLKRAYSRKMQEAEAERLKWEQANAQAPQMPTQQHMSRNDDPEPPRPTGEESQEDYWAKQGAWTDWKARQATREAEARLSESQRQMQSQLQQIEQQRVRDYVDGNLQRLTGSDWWTEEIGEQMNVLVQGNDGWRNNMMAGPEGFDQLAGYARYLVDQRKAKGVQADRVAQAPTRTVPKTTTRKTAPSMAAKPKAQNFDDAWNALAQSEEFRDLNL